VSIERSKTRLGEDIGGDEAAGSRGIPFQRLDTKDEKFGFGFMGPFPPLCPGIPDNIRPKPGEGPTCIGPVWGFELAADWGKSPPAPVPLFFTPGVCTGQGATPQTFACENPDVPWDGTGGQILTFQNCASGTVEVGIEGNRCAGGAPYGELIAVYQTDGSANPFNPSAVCTNNVFPKNPNIAGFAETAPGLVFRYDIAPGEWQLLSQTNLIGGQCAPFDWKFKLSLP
jgi:hypothetical protein